MYAIVFWTFVGGFIVSVAIAARYAFLLERRVYRAERRRELVAEALRARY